MIRNFFQKVSRRSIVANLQNSFHSNAQKRFSRYIVIGGVAAAVSGVLYRLKENDNIVKLYDNCVRVNCSTVPDSQPSVYTSTKNHALYLTIHLCNEANVKDVLKVMCNIEKFIDVISPKEFRDEDDEVLAGVGFSPNFMAKIRPNKPVVCKYSYHERKGLHGTMPSTGGDIFIHAKCNEFSKLYELAQTIIKNITEENIDKFEDVYGWVYRGGRDLSGFIDGTENPANEEHRQNVAVNPTTGGSFVITQKWVHKCHILDYEKEATVEGWIGRKRSDSTELRKKHVTSHVARMTGGANFEQAKKFEIVRQSQPFGTLSGDNGLFFIGYSSTPEALDFMLDRMVGASEDGLHDDVMRLTKCVKSAYWYFPGKKEMQELSGR